MTAWKAVNNGFDPRSDQTKDYPTDLYCFSTKHTALRNWCKYWLSGMFLTLQQKFCVET